MLVIDDDPNVRDLMARLLTKEGFGVVLRVRRPEGLALAEAPTRGHHARRHDARHRRLGHVLAALKSDPTSRTSPS